MGHYRDGFAWHSDPALQFNWHPLLMIMSMVYLYGNGKVAAIDHSTSAVNAGMHELTHFIKQHTRSTGQCAFALRYQPIL